MKISTYLRKTLSLFVSLSLLCVPFATVSYADDYSYDLYSQTSQNSDEITNIAPLASVSAINQATYGPTTALSNINDGLPLTIKSGSATGQYAAYAGKEGYRAVIRLTSDDQKSILANTIKSDDNTHFIARIEFKFDSEYEISGYKVYASTRNAVTADGITAKVDGKVVSSYKTEDVNIKEHTYAALYAAVYEHPKMTLSNSVITDSFTIDYEVPYTYDNSKYTPGQAWLTEIEIYGRKPVDVALASKGATVSATNSNETDYSANNLIDGLYDEESVFKTDVAGETSKVTLSLPDLYKIHTLKVTELADSSNKISSMKVSANGTNYDEVTTAFADGDGKQSYIIPLSQPVTTYNLDLTFTPESGKNITLYEIEAYGDIKDPMDDIVITDNTENLALSSKNTVINATNSYILSGDCSCNQNEYSHENLIDGEILSGDTHLVDHIFKSDEVGEDVTLTLDYQNKAELTDVVIVEMRDAQNSLSEISLSTLTSSYDTLDVSSVMLGKNIYHHLKLADIIETNKLLITLTPNDNKGIVLYEVMTYGTEVLPIPDVNIAPSIEKNIALGNTPNASGKAISTLTPNKLTDGNLDWLSSRYATSAAAKLVITFDFEKTHTINSVTVVERAFASERTHSVGEKFTLEVGQEINGNMVWFTISDKPLNYQAISSNNGIATDYNFDSVNGSQVRLTFEQTSDTKYQFELNEIEIYGYENPKADFNYLTNAAKRKQVSANVTSDNLKNVTDTALNTSLALDSLTDALQLTIDLEKPIAISYMLVTENKPDNKTNADDVKIEIASKKGNELIWKTVKDGISLDNSSQSESITPLNFSGVVANMVKFTFANKLDDYSDGISIEDISIYGEELPYSAFVSRPDFKLVQNSKEVTFGQLDDSLDVDIKFNSLYTKASQGIDAVAIAVVHDALTNSIKQVEVKDITLGSGVEEKITLTVSDTWQDTYISVSILDKNTQGALAPIMQWR